MENPLYYFEKVLVKTQEKYEREVYIEMSSNPYFVGEDENIKGRLKFISLDEDTKTLIDSYADIPDTIKDEINRESSLAIEKIRIDILETTKAGNSPHFYIKEIEQRINRLNELANKNFPNYPIIKEVLLKIKNSISNKNSKAYQDNLIIEDYCEDSFDWDSFNEEDKINSIKRLYQLLTTQPPIIFATEEDFINAFTGKEINSGINWLLETKNGHTSKSSLIYFIHQLKEENYIKDFDKKSFGRRIEYVFRDYNGRPLKNIKQSLNDFNKKETCDESNRIDEIISQIEQP